MDMITQLRAVRNRYDEINNQLQDPTVINNNELYRSLMKDYKNLTPIVETYDAYDAAKGAFDEAKEMLDEGGLDAEFKELAQAEYEENKEKMAFLEERLKILLLPKDENDDRSVIVEIRGGAGGEEAALFAHSLFRMYTMYAETRGWKYEVLNANETELGGMKEVSFSIEGEGAYSRLKFESGVHRVQRVPVTESQGRVHTSAAGVFVMPEVDDPGEIEIDPNDLRIDVFRSSGPGGQSVNTTDSAVRITHLPTGIVVSMQNEKSQLQNKEAAMRVLRARLLAEQAAQAEAEANAARLSQVRTVDRSERIRTYNFPENRIADHRTGYKAYNLSNVLDGDLGPVIDSAIVMDEAARLAAVGN